ncbi:hypothetical protein P7F88_01715 [Vibrio hannami]|nr:hypothetical protein [Vibrio hannami]MDG3084872.1 hypothetical protein [Vibrio hannami]
MKYVTSMLKIVLGAGGVYYSAMLLAYLPDLIYQFLFNLSMM